MAVSREYLYVATMYQGPYTLKYAENRWFLPVIAE